MEKTLLLEQMYQSIIDCEVTTAGELAREAVAAGVHPLEAIDKGYILGINEVGRRFQNGQMFLPELIAAAEAMKAALRVFDPVLVELQASRSVLGKVVIGTMRHDIHDIGKNMICSMLSAAGFEVTDLGVDVPCERFISKVKELNPDILGLSALLTTTMPEQKNVIDSLVEEGLRQGVKVIVGGAPVNREWAEAIGADGFAEDAIATVELCKKLIRQE